MSYAKLLIQGLEDLRVIHGADADPDTVQKLFRVLGRSALSDEREQSHEQA